ncbi:hypothetical protein GOB46_08615 [Sinorhizobium meliloti]|uniref:hypothetical protein n=2 Tax=Rhizobium meliloti TaxID=382 RepID=UPI001297628D|nr:hypothetical protein [Sinorhizobium meliloti]MDW9415084.1 hypothetical protein [Sinorhizobium meliloti]MDW9479958.1 hypothetical protein [Sinorhizobium meliloti]MDW9510056.1 hypothetical protein [Sinorhizobium meliloti]MDW9634634.1 hypothetical protein [Sinorhizobium meliloti]MDW9810216.1 hypothetical protein [Sinorhizobium meliloti]
MSPEEIARMAETRASGQGLSPQEIARLIETRYSRTLEGLPPEERELIIRQARRIYNDRNMHPDNPRMVMQKRTGVPVKEEYQVTPQKQGYPDDAAEREYAAETIADYMSNANGIKTDTPSWRKCCGRSSGRRRN